MADFYLLPTEIFPKSLDFSPKNTWEKSEELNITSSEKVDYENYIRERILFWKCFMISYLQANLVMFILNT